MILAHKIQLDPTVKQVNYFVQACGTARFVWNYALDQWNSIYESGEKPNGLGLKKLFNTDKYEKLNQLKSLSSDNLLFKLQNLFNEFKIEPEKIQISVNLEEVAQLIKKDICTFTNPYSPTIEDIVEILNKHSL